MNVIDCFNGDADGICALTQMRLAEPVESRLITGVKRDIKLLDRVQVQAGDQVNVLDVSLDKNRQALLRILDTGADVFYCDHHFAGDIPERENLDALINTTPNVCTSLLVSQRLNNVYLEWAVVGTFGDNLKNSAHALAKPLCLNTEQLLQLENLGVYLNYNGYGAALEDLYFDPAKLFERTSQFDTAFGFMLDDAETFQTLESGYHQDMSKAAESKAVFNSEFTEVYSLPNAPWARRVSGVFGNDLANQNPAKAHAVLSEREAGGYVVSVRAPLQNKQGADEVCRQFETGGGRAAAAGINVLPDNDIEKFISTFNGLYAG